MLLSIQFLPTVHIARFVDYLRRNATTEATRGLVDYVTRQWLNNTTFRVEDWSVYKQTIRTNNDVEGWHRREADLVKINVETGDLSCQSSSRSRRHETALIRLWNDYSGEVLITSTFLSRVRDIYRIRV